MLLLAPDQRGEAVAHLQEVLRLKPNGAQVKEQLLRLGILRFFDNPGRAKILGLYYATCVTQDA